MAKTRKDIVKSVPDTRSRVTNGSALFLAGVDERSAEARRFRDVLAEITSDLGGPDGLSEAQRQLARRCATLSVHAEAMEAGLVGAGEFDLEAYVSLTNGLGRALSRLGIKRVARDITPDLQTYISVKSRRIDAEAGDRSVS